MRWLTVGILLLIAGMAWAVHVGNDTYNYSYGPTMTQEYMYPQQFTMPEDGTTDSICGRVKAPAVAADTSWLILWNDSTGAVDYPTTIVAISAPIVPTSTMTDYQIAFPGHSLTAGAKYHIGWYHHRQSASGAFGGCWLYGLNDSTWGWNAYQLATPSAGEHFPAGRTAGWAPKTTVYIVYTPSAPPPSTGAEDLVKRHSPTGVGKRHAPSGIGMRTKP